MKGVTLIYIIIANAMAILEPSVNQRKNIYVLFLRFDLELTEKLCHRTKHRKEICWDHSLSQVLRGITFVRVRNCANKSYKCAQTSLVKITFLVKEIRRNVWSLRQWSRYTLLLIFPNPSTFLGLDQRAAASVTRDAFVFILVSLHFHNKETHSFINSWWEQHT